MRKHWIPGSLSSTQQAWERCCVPPYTKIKPKQKEWFIGTQCGYEGIYAALNLMTVQLRRLDGNLFNQITVFEHHL